MISKFSPASIGFLYVAMAASGFAADSLQQAVDLDLQSLEVSESTWTCETVDAYDGVDVAMSPLIGNDESAGFEVSVVGPDTVSFWWKVSSEKDFDVLRVTVGTTSYEISGETGWAQKIVQIPAGPQVVRWEYVKDFSDDSGDTVQDRGWVDQIRFASRVVPIIEYPSKVGAYVSQPIEIMPMNGDTATTFVLSNGAPSWISIHETTGVLSGIPPTVGDVSISITGQSSSGNSAPVSITIQVAELGLGLDTAVTGWNWRGDAPWFTQTTQTHDGVDALRSGGIDHNEYSELRLPIAGPAIIRFWWRVDSEGGHDQLSFLIDDVPATDVLDSPALIDDLEPWQKRAVAVPSGQHIIAWRYTKDGQNVEGEDAGWLDEVEIIDGQDPDSDGLPSIVEACLGLDWNQTSSDNLLLPTETNGQLSWQIIKGSDIEGIVPIIEISYDLEEWSSEPLETLSDTASELIVRERATSLKPRKFIRLSASVSPE